MCASCSAPPNCVSIHFTSTAEREIHRNAILAYETCCNERMKSHRMNIRTPAEEKAKQREALAEAYRQSARDEEKEMRDWNALQL